MAAARAQALRALLSRCSTKCHRRASPSSSSSASAAASFSTLRRIAPSPSLPASRPRCLSPSPPSAARTQTLSLASEAARGGVGGRESSTDDDEEWAIGDGGDGGGVVVLDVKWGERALAAAREVLAGHFGDDVAMFAFKVSPKGYVYVRLDKLTNIQHQIVFVIYLDHDILCLSFWEYWQVSSPGAERLLKVPEDLDRFKDMTMRVQYLVEGDNDLVSKQNLLKDGIFLLESVDTQAEHCVWKLADVRENRAEAGKGRPLNRKQKDWRLQTSFTSVKKVTLYLDSN
nr:unnamed protein product [Digitaria exilis]CAB3455718.1 unnamed protein product [Digitaria exilis]